jgi:enamine deaminase RidA (YjgF/YER057c/UK114 family)
MNRFSRRRLGIVAGGAAAALGAGAGSAAATPSKHGKGPRPTEVRVNMPAGNNPAIANGVAVGAMVAVYTSSGLGPAAANPSAPPGTPEQYVDLSLFPGGVLPAGVTITEAQAWNTLTRIVDNLTAVGLRPNDVITMKCYLKRPAGASDADYAGWNRAYRQFFANVDLVTGKPIAVPAGTGTPAPPRIVNRARPARATLEMAGLAVPGWLIEVEVQATY